MKKILTTIFTLFTLSSFAQSTLNAGGASAKTATMQHDYSVAEMTLVHTATNPNLIITQGLLQPSDNKVGIANSIFTNLSVYPNPTSNIVYLELNTEVNANLNYQVFDALGKLVINHSFPIEKGNQKFPISLEQFTSGNYILNASISNQGVEEKRSFKVQKLN